MTGCTLADLWRPVTRAMLMASITILSVATSLLTMFRMLQARSRNFAGTVIVIDGSVVANLADIA